MITRRIASCFPVTFWSIAAVALLAGCRKLEKPPAPLVAPRAVIVDATSRFEVAPLGRPLGEGRPWIAHTFSVDLDRDGRVDVLACDAQQSNVVWLRQTAPGRFEERTLGSDLRAPVHVDAADLDADGDLDLLVACMGVVFPNNDKIGSLCVLENDGQQNFKARWILENVARVTDVRAADLNDDGKLDLVVGQFGYDQGEIRWMERTGPWEFTSHELLNLSGTINVCVAELTGDGRPDIVALVSQQWEEVYLFTNEGSGRFSSKSIWGSTNEDYGSSGISLADVNRDGRIDVLYTNGDGFGPASTPGPRPWHGAQWLENSGGGTFRYHRIGDLPGAYSPVGVDLDQDGHLDVVVSSAYSDWDKKNPAVISLLWYRNDGKQNFTPHVLAHSPKDLISVTAGDFDGSGRPSLVAGGFYVFPPYENMGRLTWWRPKLQP